MRKEVKQIYASYGIDVSKVLRELAKTKISLHCWQLDDVIGFENAGALTGGIQTTGNYPGSGDVVEVFLDLGDDFYYEFEVAPNGKIFVAKSYNGRPKFIENDFFECSVKIKNSDYYVEMKIDLSKLSKTKTIKFNAFRIETKGIKPEYILQALSPTLSNSFHVRDNFLKL